ncbi:MAG: c-type cytochrome [Planctomycetes bacterium]|nr:c-type cytochrome [Planctomycetota bacterium]
MRELEGEELARFVRGRELFDRDFGHESGVGQPRFNGDSCRACHFDPVIGGSGPRDVNVIRQGISNGDGEFVSPHVGTILHKETIELDRGVMAQEVVDIFEHRQTPHLFGLGLVGLISDETIVANADPQDIDGDGISGRVSITDGGRVGRFGWKAQVPSIAEFVRDAMAVELGITVETQEGMTFGRVDDNDDTDDPELSATEAQDLAFFLTMLAPPPRQVFDNVEQVETGETLFGEVGCAACHIAELETSSGPARLYSDLLLHEILPTGSLGIEDGSANMWEFRTAPLWGVSQTAPYFHDGAADTLDQAILMHDGEAATSRDDYQALSESDRNAVLAFLSTL